MIPQYKKEYLDKIVKNIVNAGEKNIAEKRKNFEHFMLLIGTILGFSVGLVAATNGNPNSFLIFSWIADIVVVIIGGIYLVLETESRYYRTFIAANKQIELINKNDAEIKLAIKKIFQDMNKTFFKVSSGENIKEKTFIVFTRFQRKIEMSFYGVFILSLIFLIISFYK